MLEEERTWSLLQLVRALIFFSSRFSGVLSNAIVLMTCIYLLFMHLLCSWMTTKVWNILYSSDHHCEEKTNEKLVAKSIFIDYRIVRTDWDWSGTSLDWLKEEVEHLIISMLNISVNKAQRFKVSNDLRNKFPKSALECILSRFVKKIKEVKEESNKKPEIRQHEKARQRMDGGWKYCPQSC